MSEKIEKFLSEKTIATSTKQVYRGVLRSFVDWLEGWRDRGRKEWIDHLCKELGLTDEVRLKSIELLKKAGEEDAVSNGCKAESVAAAVVYISAYVLGQRRTQRDIADVAGVTEVTLRNRYRQLFRDLHLDKNEKLGGEVHG